MVEGPYVPWPSVEYYLGENQSTSYRLSAPSTHPEVSYVVGEGGREIALYVELDRRHQPPHSPLPLIRIDQIAERGMRMARIRTTQAALIRDFHDLLNAVADRIVTHDRTLDQAFGETVRAWSALLDRPRALRAEKRIGLIGELSVLSSIASAHGWSTAVKAWTGPDGEEHDFGLLGFDMEVKTTASERREHTVHGLGQLLPSGDRPLWLVSLQVTRGGIDGRTLADCVRSVRSDVAEHAPERLDRLDGHLTATGWDPEVPDDERWRLRTQPIGFLVDDQLPRLDTESVPAQFRDRIRDVTYTLDVTGLPESPKPPALLADLRLP
ncbi:PD-(D/E)XK motif protein [Streptomyces sp. NPDC058685]|uniref:PD-(D/E)XK motif protein n=1 Tax=Streptomyces sp. NPDC058685 TaxID=3346598 RepID=UPI003664C7AD